MWGFFLNGKPNLAKSKCQKKWVIRWRWCAADSGRPWPQPRLGRPLLHTSVTQTRVGKNGFLSSLESYVLLLIQHSEKKWVGPQNFWQKPQNIYLYKTRVPNPQTKGGPWKQNIRGTLQYSWIFSICVSMVFVKFAEREMFLCRHLWPARLPGDNVHAPSGASNVCVFMCLYLCTCVHVYLCICVLFMSSFCYCVLPFFVDGPTVYYLWITILTCFPLDLCYDTKWFWWKQIVKLYKRWKLIWICLTSGGGKMPQNVRDHRASDLCIKKCTFILTYFRCCSDLSWNYFKPLMFYCQF